MLVKIFNILQTLINYFISIQYLDGNWVLKDGDGAKLSTNGTWLFVDELFKIYDQMIFRSRSNSCSELTFCLLLNEP